MSEEKPKQEIPKEPHLLFRLAAEKATKNVGGNMDGFLLLYTYRGALPQERLVTYEMGGAPAIQSELFTEAGAQLIRRILSNTGDNLAAALAILNGEIVRKFLTTRTLK